jgi:hypothetical protein
MLVGWKEILEVNLETCFSYKKQLRCMEVNETGNEPKGWGEPKGI